MVLAPSNVTVGNIRIPDYIRWNYRSIFKPFIRTNRLRLKSLGIQKALYPSVTLFQGIS